MSISKRKIILDQKIVLEFLDKKANPEMTRNLQQLKECTSELKGLESYKEENPIDWSTDRDISSVKSSITALIARNNELMVPFNRIKKLFPPKDSYNLGPCNPLMKKPVKKITNISKNEIAVQGTLFPLPNEEKTR